MTLAKNTSNRSAWSVINWWVVWVGLSIATWEEPDSLLYAQKLSGGYRPGTLFIGFEAGNNFSFVNVFEPVLEGCKELADFTRHGLFEVAIAGFALPVGHHVVDVALAKHGQDLH